MPIKINGELSIKPIIGGDYRLLWEAGEPSGRIEQAFKRYDEIEVHRSKKGGPVAKLTIARL